MHAYTDENDHLPLSRKLDGVRCMTAIQGFTKDDSHGVRSVVSNNSTNITGAV